MKTKPWQDIFTVGAWDQLLERYKEGQIKSNAKSRGEKISHFIFRKKYKLPKIIAFLDQRIRHYHDIPKRSIENLPVRAGELRVIAGTARVFLDQYKIPDNLKNNAKQNIRRKVNAPKTVSKRWKEVRKKGISRTEEDMIRKKQTTAKEIMQKRYNESQSDAFTSEYSTYKDTSFDYAVTKLIRRAMRKAEYIEQLRRHVMNADRGFAGGRDHLLAYIRSKAYTPDDDNLVRMKPEVLMEKIDP